MHSQKLGSCLREGKTRLHRRTTHSTDDKHFLLRIFSTVLCVGRTNVINHGSSEIVEINSKQAIYSFSLSLMYTHIRHTHSYTPATHIRTQLIHMLCIYIHILYSLMVVLQCKYHSLPCLWPYSRIRLIYYIQNWRSYIYTQSLWHVCTRVLAITVSGGLLVSKKTRKCVQKNFTLRSFF